MFPALLVCVLVCVCVEFTWETANNLQSNENANCLFQVRPLCQPAPPSRRCSWTPTDERRAHGAALPLNCVPSLMGWLNLNLARFWSCSLHCFHHYFCLFLSSFFPSSWSLPHTRREIPVIDNGNTSSLVVMKMKSQSCSEMWMGLCLCACVLILTPYWAPKYSLY